MTTTPAPVGPLGPPSGTGIAPPPEDPSAATSGPEGAAPVRPPFAFWWRRVAATVLDGCLAGMVSFLAGGPFQAPWSWQLDLGTTAHPSVSGWWYLGTMLVLLTFQAYTGATPGKRAMGISIVRASDDRPLGLALTLVREVAHVVDGFLFIGFLRPLWHKRRRTFADSIVESDALFTREPRPHRWVAWYHARRQPRLSPGVVTTVAGVVCTIGVLGSVAVNHTWATGADERCLGTGAAQVDAPPGDATLGDTSDDDLFGDDGANDDDRGVDPALVDSPTRRLLGAHLTTPGWTSETRLGITRRSPAPGEATFRWRYGGPVTGLSAVLGPAGPDGTIDEASALHLHVDLATGEATLDHGGARISATGPGDVEVSFVPDGVVDPEADWPWRAAVEPASGELTGCSVAH